MVKSRALVCLLVIAGSFSSLSYAASVSADRITGDLASGAKTQIRGNVHGLARREFDLGRADSSRMLHVISLSFQPSAAQQNDLNLFLEQLGDRTSPNYHKYLTPAQFADRFGMTQNDINKVVAWLQSEGFLNITVSNSRDMVSFDGTVAQIESTFALEMHNYLVNGEVHLANAGEPSVPAAMAGSVLSVGHLHDFSPRPRVKMRPHFTSYISGNHFLTPADFATIYNVTPLYTAGNTGSGQQIVVVGQSTVAASDLANFRSAAQLPAATVTMNSSIVGSGTATRCPGDEGESDLDLEWSNGVAKGASVTFVFAPLSNGDICGPTRQGLTVWDALHAAIQHNMAPFISISYGFCESNTIGIPLTQAQTYQMWAKQAITQGQTITAASGDSGAADCDTGPKATNGLAVDVPASIPEVTGAGGNEFTGDSPTFTSNNPAGGDNPPYWSGAGTTTDTISSALEYIPEEAWNDDALSLAGANPSFSASGGGASAFFSKPSYQTALTPADGKRDVPDVSLNASADHDGYLVCSEDDGSASVVATCTNGFRDSSSNLDIVGGTSASSPTFTAILALMNQFLGNAPPTGLAPVNPELYKLAGKSPSPFHDVTAGNNIVPCTTSTPNCTTGTMGFSAGLGYDQVTGLGSPNANALAQAWEADVAEFTVTAGALSPTSIAAGSSTTATITVAPLSPNGTPFTGTVSFSCNGLPTGATCTFNPTSVDVTSTTTTITTQVTITTVANMAASTTPVTVKGVSGSSSAKAAVSLVVTATTQTFQLNSPTAGGTLSVAQGQVTGAVNITVTSSSTPSFVISSGSGQQTALAVTYTCSGLPTESNCLFTPGTMNTATTQSTTLTLTIQTTAPTARLQRPLDRGPRIFYAVLLPGLFGIVLTFSARKRSYGTLRILALVIGLGFSTLWMASCGGTSGGSSNSNPGTPVGSSTVVVNATTGGANPITSSLTFTLTVTP